MVIDKNNYKQYYIAFIEGKLNDEVELLLMDFLELNPELITEENLDSNIQLNPENITFHFKTNLKHSEDDISDIPEFDILAIKQIEGCQTEEDKNRIKQLIKESPNLANDLELYSKTKLSADNSILYSPKSGIKRHILGLNLKITIWSSIAAAIIFGIILFNNNQDNVTESYYLSNNIVKTPDKKDSIKTAKRKITARKNTPKDTLNNSNRADKKINTKNKQMPIEPFIDLEEPLLVKMNSIPVRDEFAQPKLNAYEIALNELMPLYIKNQIKIDEIKTLQAYRENPEKESTVLKLLEGGIKLTNLFAKNKMKVNKYYDENGHMIAYQLKGESLEWTKKVNEK